MAKIKNPLAKKAYQVRDDYEGNACIVFARYAIAARREGAAELGIDFESVESCTREPYFDEYATQGWVPVKAKIEAGWWCECDGCYTQVDSDTPAPLFERGGHKVFCTAMCFIDSAAERGSRLAEKLYWHALVQERWPWADADGIHVGTVNREGRNQREVSFHYEGRKGMFARWYPESDNHRSVVFISEIDNDTWTAHKEARKAAA